jgi:hypothetical protein
MLAKKDRDAKKKNRLNIYDERIFEMEMDLTAAVAAEETEAETEIKKNLDKLRLAREAVEKM